MLVTYSMLRVSTVQSPFAAHKEISAGVQNHERTQQSRTNDFNASKLPHESAENFLVRSKFLAKLTVNILKIFCFLVSRNFYQKQYCMIFCWLLACAILRCVFYLVLCRKSLDTPVLHVLCLTFKLLRSKSGAWLEDREGPFTAFLSPFMFMIGMSNPFHSFLLFSFCAFLTRVETNKLLLIRWNSNYLRVLSSTVAYSWVLRIGYAFRAIFPPADPRRELTSFLFTKRWHLVVAVSLQCTVHANTCISIVLNSFA